MTTSTKDSQSARLHSARLELLVRYYDARETLDAVRERIKLIDSQIAALNIPESADVSD